MKRHSSLKRTVAHLDIAGFKNLLKNEKFKLYKDENNCSIDHYYKHLHSCFTKYIKLFDEHYERMFNSHFTYNSKRARPLKPIRITFSDSLFIFSQDETLESFEAVMLMAISICATYMGLRLPTRGGISYGDCLIDRENNIYFGDAIVKAVELEKKPDQFGVILNPYDFPFYGDTLSSLNKSFMHPYSHIIPKSELNFYMKDDGNAYDDYYMLNWVYYTRVFFPRMYFESNIFDTGKEIYKEYDKTQGKNIKDATTFIDTFIMPIYKFILRDEKAEQKYKNTKEYIKKYFDFEAEWGYKRGFD